MLPVGFTGLTATGTTLQLALMRPNATGVDPAATGQYDSTANTFTANRIAVLINDGVGHAMFCR